MNAAPAVRVEIWSDLVCPFCYIGKRQMERALGEFAGAAPVEVTWRSFQLQPDVTSDPSRSAMEHLAARKGWTLDYTRGSMNALAARGREFGIDFRFEAAVVSNTFDAHRVARYAATLGRADEIQERLFAAYFSQGRCIGDPAVLGAVAVEAGLPAPVVRSIVAEGAFADDVREDIDQALQFGINGVPFFVFERRYAVSGAEGSAVLLQALRRCLDDRRQG